MSDPGAELQIGPGVELFGANLRGVDLSGADFSGAIYNRDTSWPDGFDPVAAGAVAE